MMSSAVVPAGGEPLSEGARVVDTFIAPSKTFQDINRSAMWWLPFLIIVIVSYAFVFTVDKKVGFERVSENQIRLNPKRADQLDQLPPEQRERQMQIAAKFTRYVSYGIPVVSLAIFSLIALVLMGSYNFGAGAQVSFSKSMAVVVYSNMVGVIRAVLAIIALFAGADPETFNMQNPAATNLAYFIDPAQHNVLFALGSWIDIVSIWMLCLTALGFTYICKVKKGTSFAIVFGWYVLMMLLSTGAAAAFS